MSLKNERQAAQLDAMYRFCLLEYFVWIFQVCLYALLYVDPILIIHCKMTLNRQTCPRPSSKVRGENYSKHQIEWVISFELRRTLYKCIGLAMMVAMCGIL